MVTSRWYRGLHGAHGLSPSALGLTAAVVMSTLLWWAPGIAPRAVADTCDTPNAQFFNSPSGNISCELDFQRAGIDDAAYCVSFEPPQHVPIGPGGSLRDVCTQDVSCLSKPPIGVPTLLYGQSKGIGRFTCLSQESGMTCTAAPSGTGFTISSSPTSGRSDAPPS